MTAALSILVQTVFYTFLSQCKQWGVFCIELHVKKHHPSYSDIRQLASADELFEAYQSTTDPDLFQVSDTFMHSYHWYSAFQ